MRAETPHTAEAERPSAWTPVCPRLREDKLRQTISSAQSMVSPYFYSRRKYLLNKPGLDLRKVTRKCLVDEAICGHLPEVGSVQPLLIEKMPPQPLWNQRYVSE